MNQDEAFLQAIRAEPDDDAVRLIYADWLEEHGGASAQARAEFIRVQCRLARLNRTDPHFPVLQQREGKLLRENWRAWIEPLADAMRELRWRRQLLERIDPGTCFCRGFIESLQLDAEVFLHHTEAIARLTTLRRLSLRAAGSRMTELAACPFLADLTQLSFCDYFSDPLDAAGAAALASSPHLQRLSILNLTRNNIADAGLMALASAPWIAQLTSLDLSDNGLSAAGVFTLAASPYRPKLRRLILAQNWPGADGVDALVRATNLYRTVYLDLRDCQLWDADVAPLLDWPGLTENILLALNLNGNHLSTEMRERLHHRGGGRVSF
jgi:uncharacterized protein (TIGR02996 family)